MVDKVKNFVKKANNVYGHDVGDDRLKLVADILNSSTRETDICACWGAEEFIVLVETENVDVAFEFDQGTLLLTPITCDHLRTLAITCGDFSASIHSLIHRQTSLCCFRFDHLNSQGLAGTPPLINHRLTDRVSSLLAIYQVKYS